MNQSEAIATIINKALQELVEFDVSIEIMSSYVDDDGQTQTSFCGQGDWNSRIGMAHSFIARDRAREYLNVKQEEEQQR